MDGLSAAVNRARALRFAVNGVEETPIKTKVFDVTMLADRLETLEARRSADAVVIKHLVGRVAALEAGLGKLAVRENPRPTIESIKQLVCDRYKLTVAEMTCDIKSEDVLRPRQIAMYLCTKYSGRSTPIIGEHFGGREHSIVLHSKQQVMKRRKTDIGLDAAICELEAALEARL